MTGLVSKWANEEPASAKAEIFPIRSPPQSPTKPANKIASKWANVLDSTPQPKLQSQASPRKGSQKPKSSLPTPPTSTGNDGSGVTHGNDGDWRRNGQSNRRRKSDATGSKSAGSKAPGRSLADRISSMDISCNRDQKKPHARRGSRDLITPKKTGTSNINTGNESEEEFPTKPMTAAAKSFASRIGVPGKESEPASHSRSARTGAHKPPQSSNREKPTLSKAPSQPASKYMTPKQKRNHDAEEKQAKLAQEQARKEAKLKAEVQSMFNKMNDKSTNWADLEDESD